MRVSKTFKAVAAPLLYEKLDWNYMQRDPMKLMKEGDEIRAAAGITTKEDELQHIKSIELQRHLVKDCPVKGRRARLQPLEISVVQVNMGKSRVGDVPGGKYCLEHQHCPLLQGLETNKVVVSTTSQNGQACLDPFYARLVDEHVIKLDLRDSDWHNPQLHSDSKAKRLLMILSPAEKAWPFYPHYFHNEGLRRCMLKLANRLVIDSLGIRSPQDITLVNFDDLESRLVSPAPSPPYQSFEVACKSVMSQKMSVPDQHRSARLHKTVSEAAMISFKFITMKKYLEEYDWDGVYTKEEAAELL
jgi:hypothetical protein